MSNPNSNRPETGTTSEIQPTTRGAASSKREPGAESNGSNPKPSRRRKPNGDSKKKSQKQNKAKASAKEDSSDPTSSSKFLQISKLIKKYKPITINGVSTKTLVEQIKQKEIDSPDYFKSQYTNSERLSFLQKHLLEYSKNQPDAPVYLSFIIKPSDPDFPFDLESLKLNMSIPPNYPRVKAQRPTVVVLNDDIPRGFAVNIELGYRRIVDIALNKVSDEEIKLCDGTGLQSQLMTLDKYLELFLKQEKRETIKFVKTRKVAKTPEPEGVSSTATTKAVKPQPKPTTQAVNTSAIPQEVINRRAQLLEEMNDKFGSRIKLFKKSAHENRYKISLPIFSKSPDSTIPELWRLNNALELMVSVPINYPEGKLSVTVPNNFNTNLILKYKNTPGTDQMSLLEITRYYKQVEKNLAQNINHYGFDSSSLISILNWITNNLDKFCRPENEFASWIDDSKSLRAVLA